MHRNPYNEIGYFKYYQQMRRSDINLNDAVINPFVESVLPKSVVSKNILDLGCGAGDLAKHLASLGAKIVVGVDSSEMMISQACCDAPPNCKFLLQDISTPLDQGISFDLIVSVMVLHYVKDIEAVLEIVNSNMKAGGSFIVAIEHPLFLTGQPGWVEDDEGNIFYGIGSYIEDKEIPRSVVDASFTVYHRSIERYINILNKFGFINIYLHPLNYSRNDEMPPDYSLHTFGIPVALGISCSTST